MKSVSGSVEKCLMHYYDTISGLERAEMLFQRELLAEFTGASVHTVRRWNAPARGMPGGMVYIKLKFFLELLGYEVDELRKLATDYYGLAELAVFTSYDEKSLADELGYQNYQSVLNIMNGNGETSGSKLQKLMELRSVYENDIKASREAWANRIRIVVSPPREVKRPSSAKEAVTRVSDSHEENLLQLGYLILATVNLAEKIASDDYTAEDRKHLREITGGDQVFRFSNALNKLCGEKARQMILGSNGKKEDGGEV